ncbi:DUF2795 domain-containing protein [Patescibacteria group bacterium]|nr:DUF2795 domain-containing protein [Patescibacteria group bacterium]
MRKSIYIQEEVSNLQSVQSAIDHLEKHQSYPATKEELVKECNELSDFSASDKEWFMKNLPEGTYKSAEDVIGVLGLKPAQSMAM